MTPADRLNTLLTSPLKPFAVQNGLITGTSVLPFIYEFGIRSVNGSLFNLNSMCGVLNLMDIIVSRKVDLKIGRVSLTEKNKGREYSSNALTIEGHPSQKMGPLDLSQIPGTLGDVLWSYWTLSPTQMDADRGFLISAPKTLLAPAWLETPTGRAMVPEWGRNESTGSYYLSLPFQIKPKTHLASMELTPFELASYTTIQLKMMEAKSHPFMESESWGRWASAEVNHLNNLYEAFLHQFLLNNFEVSLLA